jgi:short-subunit dehydrogenase
MNIVDKTILVTGASDGIGKSIALQLARHNANLVLFGRDNTKLGAVKQACEALSVRAATYAFDITDDAKRDTVIAEVLATQQIDVLINNAGIWHKSTELADLSAETIQSVITTNLTAHMLTTKGFIASMRSRETAIVNIISSAGLQGRAGRTAYAASKFGMRGFTEALREETKDDPIRIGAVFQSGTNTQMFAKAGEDMPLESYTDPNDLAEVVVFMLTRPPKLWLNEIRVVY